MHQRSSVVEYYSKSLSPMAKRYLEFEKELFAIVCTLKKWSMHLDDEFNLLMNENYIVDYYRMSRDKGVSCRVRLWCKIISSYPIIFNGHYD
ncbi:hypothetical protein NEMIN01_2048 [Nematocida minor]|uniref:uncharacterized protein n=1 Tax=Nematocida minor TaxID=1912983 RepID=UPI00221F29E6|nr:uncharacterized protein NEMIN01_2048 [Nematocida minor]KAI5192497.1 hypothetical protein NEMIN01_2048 [Nematocida minor]